MDKLDRADEADKPAAIPFPEHLKREGRYPPGAKRVKVDRWIKPEYHDLEVERIWKKAWQMACREDEIPEVGDYVIYDVAELSFIIMRTAKDEIRAYWNSCPHRGRKLREYEGRGVSELRCMFHGWSWNLDGSAKAIPCQWDFPLEDEEFTLAQAKVGLWGGFVFINPDLDCEPLADFLGTLPDSFEGAGNDLATRWKQVHVACVIDCNWKVGQEAFIEAWHSNTTHPQFAFAGIRTGGGRWDDFGNWMRSAPNLPSDSQEPKPHWMVYVDDHQLAVNSWFDYHLNEISPHQLKEGETYGAYAMRHTREHIRGIIGDKVDQFHDAELGGGSMIAVFPNFHPWGGFSRLVYRFRPYLNDCDRCIMDVIFLSPWPEDKPKPPPAPVRWLAPGEPITAARELGQLAKIFVQDIGNMPRVQQGMKTSGRGYLVFSEHHEAPVRHFHDLYDKWMGLEDGQ